MVFALKIVFVWVKHWKEFNMELKIEWAKEISASCIHTHTKQAKFAAFQKKRMKWKKKLASACIQSNRKLNKTLCHSISIYIYNGMSKKKRGEGRKFWVNIYIMHYRYSSQNI